MRDGDSIREFLKGFKEKRGDVEYKKLRKFKQEIDMRIYIAIDVPEDFENCLNMQRLIQHEIINDRWSWSKDSDVLRQIADKLDELNNSKS